MSRYILALEIDDAFYQEFAAQGTAQDKLLEQLRLDLEDQLDEYDLENLLTRMVSTGNHANLIGIARKKQDEQALLPQFVN